MTGLKLDRTALSYWFPKLEAAGLPVPRTKIIAMPRETQEAIWRVFDGLDEELDAEPFFGEIAVAAAEFGSACFLRTDHTSGKHRWDNACFLANSDAVTITAHVLAIVEYSEMAAIVGPPWSTWAVREMLPTKPFGVCPRYGNMPVCREFRFFVDDGKVRCAHPYWPEGALRDGGAVGLDYAELCRMDAPDALRDLAEAAGRVLGGSWSIDLLDTERGWFITDLAEAHTSFHWEGCASALPDVA